MKRLKRGQTLLELVIAVGVVAVIVTGLVVAATAALRFGQESRTRTTAVKYAQEAIERARQIRDSQSTDTFLSYSGTGQKSWCLSQDGTWSEMATECPPIQAQSPYARKVTFTWADPTMTVTSNVTWQVGSQISETELSTYLTLWR